MKAYWDSSALVAAIEDRDLNARLASEKGYSRRHALTETFAALTGKPHLRISATKAAIVLEQLAADLDFIELMTEDILQAFKAAEALGVRGGRVHDFLHAKAAIKSGAKILLTLDRNDFEGLVEGLAIEQV